jgi:hypothetical protein
MAHDLSVILCAMSQVVFSLSVPRVTDLSNTRTELSGSTEPLGKFERCIPARHALRLHQATPRLSLIRLMSYCAFWIARARIADCVGNMAVDGPFNRYGCWQRAL